MTVRPAVILARLAHLSRVLDQLERLQQMSSEYRQADPIHMLAAERALHVALEAIFDIGHHVLAGRKLPIPAAYREILPALVAAGVVPVDVEQRLRGVAGFRNLLVHDYAELDAERVWALIDTRLSDLREVERCLADIPELGRG